MDRGLIDVLCSGLSTATPIGSVYRSDVGLIAIPFLCEDHAFLALYQPVSFDPEDHRCLAEFVLRETGHEVSASAHLMKFVAADRYRLGDQNFSPLAAPMPTRLSIYRKIPEVLGRVTNVVLNEVSELSEIYFIPGGTDKRAARLNLWYARIADAICANYPSLQRIHPDVGEGWYGYRKVESREITASKSREYQQDNELTQPIAAAGKIA